MTTNNTQAPPFAGLTPDTVLSAVESLGYLSDARIYPLNSYENRVYQVGIEEADPIIAKFYRPLRWTDEQIIEDHQFSLNLASTEVPVVPPIEMEGKTLFQYETFRFALYQRRGGHAPELDDDDNLYTLGLNIGRIHALGKSADFIHRPHITIQDYALDSREFLLEKDFIPSTLLPAYESLSTHVVEKVSAIFEATPYRSIRLHGDCHPGNILWRDDAPNFVDLDDCRSGPAVQDLWMLLSGDTLRRQVQLSNIIEGYETFCEFDSRELSLIESLRTLRIMHYAAWLARRWDDPAFPMHFPWFNTERYWSEHILELREQLANLDEPPLSLSPY